MQQLKIFIIHPSDRLTDHLPDGDGLVAYGYIKHLADRGHIIYIAARSYSLSKPFLPNVRVFVLKQWFKVPLLDRIEYTIRGRLLFEKWNKVVDFDLLQQMNPVFVGLSLAFIGCKKPVVLGTIVPRWSNDADSLGSRYPVFRSAIDWFRNRVMALQQRHASALLLSSRAAMNKVPEAEQVRHKIHYIPLGMDADTFSPRSDSPKYTTEPSILFLGSLVQKKGIFTLLDAYHELLATLPSVRLVIAGGGEQASEVKQRVDALRKGAKVRLVGRVGREVALALLRDTTVLCQPSFGEPYGNSLVEAMSCGKPVVATNAGGIPELVHPDGAILVPPGDPVALANALKQIILSEDLQKAMGAINREHVKSHLTWTVVVSRLESIYESVLSSGDLNEESSRLTARHPQNHASSTSVIPNYPPGTGGR